MNNPLLEKSPLPRFSQLQPAHAIAAIDFILQDNQLQIDQLLDQEGSYTWKNLMQPLEELEDRLNSAWSVVNHVNAVMNSEELRAVYHACLPKISEYATNLAHNIKLFDAIKSLSVGKQFAALDAVQQKIISDKLRDFHLAGVDLAPADKHSFSLLQKRLTELMSRFEDNLLDATHAWQHLVADESELAGLPNYAVRAAKELAQQKNLTGWLFSLDAPSYMAVMCYADCSELRRTLYSAYVTRASDQGPTAGKWDNSALIEEILAVRQQIAKLLNFSNYAELSLATKAAASTQQVIDFLNTLAQHALPLAKNELKEIASFAKEKFGKQELKAWDIAYYSEKLRLHKFSISDEQLRAYFPEDQVLTGLFAVTYRLFGMTVKEKTGVDTWHEDVKFYEIYDENKQLRGQFYLDLYARANKRGGAWMDECYTHRRLANGEIQNAVVFITCNFTPPLKPEPALLTHDEVITLFHEFGHGLHHMLTQVDYADASGGSGVPWDVIEFPSQFMENWAWEKAAIDLMARHYQTEEAFSEALYKQLRASRAFHAGLQLLRQLEFSLFDFQLHLEQKSLTNQQIQQLLNTVRSQCCVVPVPDFNRFQHSFAHIFGTNAYAAGYYSYKWAEVMSCDAFAKFEERGIFDRKTGEEFLHTILEKGGAEDPIKLFVEFRGREPRTEILLQQIGVTSVEANNATR